MTTHTTTPATTEIDQDALMSFVLRAVDEVGTALNAALVVMGDQFGYYRALADQGPLAAPDLARLTATDEHYAREWLNAQAAGSYLDYDPAIGTYRLSPEHAIALTDESSPANLQGLFQIAHGTIRDTPQLLAAARTGDGYGWHEHNGDVHVGCERFFRPSYLAYLTAVWLPALDGIIPKLEQGARVLDVGCGHGASTILMAQAFSASTFLGTDYHAASIEVARERAAEAGVSGNTEFQVAGSTDLPGTDYALVTMFDCLHDMGDPLGAARQVREILAPGGSWMIVEPIAGPPRGELQPRRPRLLRLLHPAVHPGVAVAGRRHGPGHAGGARPDPRRRHRGGLHPVPYRGRHPVQQCVRGQGMRGRRTAGP